MSAKLASADQSTSLEAGWVKRVERWIEKGKSAEIGDVVLDRKRIYILPTKQGILFGLMIMVMGITSINYKLSLGFGVVFLLAGLGWTSMFHTFGNLHRIVLIPGRVEPVFAGELAPISLTMKNPNKSQRYSIRLSAPQFVKQALIDLTPKSERTLRFALRTTNRGWLAMPKMTVDTLFPIGIWRAWSRWQPALKVLVYPQPEASGIALPEATSAGFESMGRGSGNDDIAALRPWREGDSPRIMAWKAMARSTTDQMLSKEFDGGVSGELQLDWSATPNNLGIEGRISRLTRWVLDAESAGMKYALSLPTIQLPADSGAAHQAQCLTELALLEI